MNLGCIFWILWCSMALVFDIVFIVTRSFQSYQFSWCWHLIFYVKTLILGRSFEWRLHVLRLWYFTWRRLVTIPSYGYQILDLLTFIFVFYLLTENFHLVHFLMASTMALIFHLNIFCNNASQMVQVIFTMVFCISREKKKQKKKPLKWAWPSIEVATHIIY
jgi:hypothetical protein